MRYLSVCSGIEAASCAWHPLGWRPVAFSEIEPFPCAVLAHHYPNVPNLGDMTRFQEWPDADVDVLVGGTPCQSFSVAGLRKGLADPRGNLMLTYLAIADRYRPEWLVWENVPGVLSSSGGRDFGTFLGGLAELGYGFAYRVLDAQFFGVAQRRRRVFVVGRARDWRRAAAVLFERASLSGHPAPSRETREGTAERATVGTLPSGGTTRGHGTAGVNNQAVAAGHVVPVVPERARALTTSNQRIDAETETLIPIAFDTRQSDVMQYGEKTGPLDTCGFSMGILKEDSYAGAYEADASSVLRTLRQTVGSEAVAEWGSRILDSLQSPQILRAWLHGESIRRASSDFKSFVDDRPLPRQEGAAAATLRKVWKNGPDGCSPQGRGLAKQLAQQLGKALPQLPRARASQQSGMQVRRLTPRECERLMGFPDDYTLIQYRGKPAADGPRYKALGNSMAVPCMRWIGARIDQVTVIGVAQEVA